MTTHTIRNSLPGASAAALLLFVAVMGTSQATSATPGEWLSNATASTALTELIGFLEDTQSPVDLEGGDDAVLPVPESAQLMSRYGVRRGRTTGRPTFHAGLDFYAPRGTPVYATRPGVVEIVALDSARSNSFMGYGNAVVIYHEDEDRWTFYAHLDEALVVPGMVVEAGDEIGRVGNTTNRRFQGMGVHLHFEVRVRAHNGQSPFPGRYRVNNIDPERWLGSHGIHFDNTGKVITEESEVESGS